MKVLLFETLLFLFFDSIFSDPEVVAIDAITSTTYIDLSVTTSASSFVYCAAYTRGSVPMATESIKAQNNMGFVNQILAPADIRIPNLYPFTSYDMYCVAEIDAYQTPLQSVLAQSFVFQTSCCKNILVNLLANQVPYNTNVMQFLRVSLDAPPSSKIVVTFSAKLSSGESIDITKLFLVSNLTFTNSSWSSVVLPLKANSFGTYTLSASASGNANDGFDITFSGGSSTPQSFDVLGSGVSLSPPSVLSSMFIGDGSKIMVTFGSPTNKPACDSLFAFADLISPTCLWQDDSNVIIMPSSSSTILIDTIINVNGGLLKAKCTTGSDCATWESLASTTITIASPLVSVLPSVSIRGPSKVGSCNTPIFDVTSSTGSGGRPWKSFSVAVSGSDETSVADLQSFFDDKYVVNPPTPIPHTMLVSGNSYSLLFTLCNFFDICGTGKIIFNVDSTIIPVVSVSGKNSITQNPAAALSIKSFAYVLTCDGVKDSKTISYAWSVTKDGSPVSLSSSGKDKSTFQLKPFSLNGNSNYQFTVTASSTLGAVSSSSSIAVSTSAYNLVAMIAGGSSSKTIRQASSDYIFFDGSSSYDEASMVPGATTTSLSYSWTCQQTYPTLSYTCPVDLINTKTSTCGVVPSSSAVEGDECVCTLTISDSTTRVSSASTTVVVGEPDVSLVTIIGPLVERINPDSILTLQGIVDLGSSALATWTVNGEAISVDSASTVTSKILSSGVNTFNLVVNPNSFDGRAQNYLFTLTCGSGSSTISINYNMPPTVGSLHIDLTSGNAFDTKFTLSANDFTDFENDLPLSYVFGYISNEVFMILQGNSETSFSSTTLPASTSGDNMVYCRVKVFDHLNAMSYADKSVEVFDLSYTFSALEEKLSFVASSSGAGNLDELKAIVFGITTYINSNPSGDSSSVRDSLITNVGSLSAIEDASDDTIAGWLVATVQISSVPSDLTATSIDSASNLANTILDSANSGGISYDRLDGVLDVVSSIIQAEGLTNRRRHLVAADSVSTDNILDKYGDYISSNMVEGQTSVEMSTSVISLSAQVKNINGEKSFSSSISENECKVSGSSSFNGAVPLYMASTASSSILNVVDSNPFSPSIRVKFADTSHGANVDTFSFKIKNDVTPIKGQSVNDNNHTMICNGKSDSTVHSFKCRDAKDDVYDYTVSCEGLKSKTYVVQCPYMNYQSGCQIFSGATNFKCDIDPSSTDDVTICTCSRYNRRRLGANDDFEDSGAFEVAGSVTLVSTEFAVTIEQKPPSLKDLQHAFIVLLLYGSLWGLGISGLIFCTVRDRYKLRKVEMHGGGGGGDIESKAAVSNVKSKEAVREYLNKYVRSIFPAVFRADSGWTRLWFEIQRHHRYIQLFSSENKNNARRIITGVHLMTVQSMLMFMLAVVYDVQFPEDDGTCAGYTTQKSCLMKKSLFDPSSTLCEWSSSDDGEEVCLWLDSKFSFASMIVISVVIAILTTPVNLIVDFLCIDILTAPTADDIKLNAQENIAKKVGRRLSNVARRASNVTMDAVNSIVKKIEPKKRQTMVMTKTMVVPGATKTAHSLASVSVKDFLYSAKQNNEEFVSHRVIERTAAMTVERARSERKQHINHSSTIGEIAHHGGNFNPSAFEVHSKVGKGLNSSVQSKFLELSIDMKDQRKKLKPCEQEEFDNYWGVDPTGEFSQQNNWLYGFMNFKKNSKFIIMNNLKSTIVTTEQKLETLRIATDLQIGLEILHQFITDILGRESAAAKIFMAKSNEDFRYSVVVTKWAKIFAVFGLILINFFFVYFSIQRGLQRGHAWQMVYLVACLMQIGIEIVIYETSECAIVHFVIPSLVHNEIRAAALTLDAAVEKICLEWGNVDKSIVLDAPQYFFISTNLAKSYPDLMESVIVQSYHTYLPGEIGKKWRINHAGRGTHMITRFANFAMSSIIMQSLQRLGAMNGGIQRTIIHFLQPFLVSSLLLLWLTMTRQPYVAIPVGLFVLYIIYQIVKDIRKNRVAMSNQIVPLVEVDKQDVKLSEKVTNTGSLSSAVVIPDQSVVEYEIVMKGGDDEKDVEEKEEENGSDEGKQCSSDVEQSSDENE